jgi:hypothetical protein
LLPSPSISPIRRRFFVLSFWILLLTTHARFARCDEAISATGSTVVVATTDVESAPALAVNVTMPSSKLSSTDDDDSDEQARETGGREAQTAMPTALTAGLRGLLSVSVPLPTWKP